MAQWAYNPFSGNLDRIGNGGGGGVVDTIAGDTGSITGANVTIFSNLATNNSGGTVFFDNTGTISTLNMSDAASNTTIGNASGGSLIGGAQNTALGFLSLGLAVNSNVDTAIGAGAMSLAGTTGASQYNVAVGGAAIANATEGFSNTVVGHLAGNSLQTGSENVLLGESSGISFIGNESRNIIIKNDGVAGDNDTIRIGFIGGFNPILRNFQGGIAGVTVANSETVTIDTITGQLGSQPIIAGDITLTGDSGSPLVANSFNLFGQDAGVVPVMNVSTATGNVLYENRTWETQYVVDNSTTVGLRGTFATVQAAVDQAFADGNATAPFTANIMIRPGFYELSALVIPNDARFHFYGILPPTDTLLSVRFSTDLLAFNTNSELSFTNITFVTRAPSQPNASVFTYVRCKFQNGVGWNGGSIFVVDSAVIGSPTSTISNPTISVNIINSRFGVIFFNSITNEAFELIARWSTIGNTNGTCLGLIKLFYCDITSIQSIHSQIPATPNLIINCSTVTQSGFPGLPALRFAGNFLVSGMSGNIYNATPTILNNPATQGNVIASRTVAANYNATIFDYYIGVTDTSAVRTITLPNPANVFGQLSLNQTFIIKDQSMAAATNNITINTVAGQIDGAATQIINTNGGSRTLKSDGVNYWTI